LRPCRVIPVDVGSEQGRHEPFDAAQWKPKFMRGTRYDLLGGRKTRRDRYRPAALDVANRIQSLALEGGQGRRSKACTRVAMFASLVIAEAVDRIRSPGRLRKGICDGRFQQDGHDRLLDAYAVRSDSDRGCRWGPAG